MFKLGSCSDEIMESMDKQLTSNAIEKETNSNKIAKAVNCLSASIKIFKNAGMDEEANKLLNVIKTLNK